jgi:hypothetical protein
MTAADNLSVKKEANVATNATKATATTATIIRDCFAEVFDMVGDWVYLYAITHRDYNKDGEVDEYPAYDKVDYAIIVYVVASFCVLSVFFAAWTILTSIGRARGMNSICCNCTVPRLVMLSVVMEDVPQFIMTVWIDYTFTGGLSPAGMLNICSSVTGIVNRLTTRYDEIIEEGDEELGTDESHYVSMNKVT